MKKGSEFTPVDRGKILGLREAGWTFAAIRKHIGRSAAGVSKFWRNKDTYGTAKRPGRPKKVCERTKRHIVLAAKKAGASPNSIKTSLTLTVSARTVRRVLQQSPHMGYGKRNRTPMLKTSHKVARRKWGRSMIKLRTDWGRVIFSDEKKFNLDGPDGLQYYWHDLRCEKETYFSRQNGRGSVMVWGGFSLKGKTDLAFLHDNASIHASKSTKAFLESSEIEILQWPALSPDLNPIENVWGYLTRDVYSDGKQYMTLEDLKDAILDAWEKLDMSRLQELVKSMLDRVADVVEDIGKKTKH
ncbi:hypothetical protein JG688_00008758 [Phytophthora aleatoria]|uniref:Tc1-like transposase DDE domain-containing protein n=1 Tax=Phytophthora aleatoria TaxID=2496075 RepID=A0A8J5J4G9_9STRA|nr:hypothetical protein JG688_00008758 [Phytophthora aleatoria]